MWHATRRAGYTGTITAPFGGPNNNNIIAYLLEVTYVRASHIYAAAKLYIYPLKSVHFAEQSVKNFKKTMKIRKDCVILKCACVLVENMAQNLLKCEH